MSWCSSRFFHTRTVARARARISKDGIRRWSCSLSAVSTCRRTAWMWWCCLRGGFEGGDLLAAHLPEFWQQGDEREGQHRADAWHRGQQLTALSESHIGGNHLGQA